MAFPFHDSRSRFPQAAAFGAVIALLLGCPQPGRSQQAAPPPPAVASQQMPSLSPSPLQDGVSKGTLFYATAPQSEQSLRQADATPDGVSFTVPLVVDRKNNRLFVQALINNRKVRLILDICGGPVIALNETTGKGITLDDQVPVQMGEPQGVEPAVLGLAKSLTLGNLTLQNIPITVTHDSNFYNCTLGLSAFEHYRVTLDFAANTMTLTRGGKMVLPSDRWAVSMPFDDDAGYPFLPVRVLGQPGWAMLDSGAPENILSIEAATVAAAQLPASDANTITLDQKIGAGSTARKFKAIKLKTPVPISLDVNDSAYVFSTTSWGGAPVIDDVLNSQVNAHITAILGLPFLLQFQRVIIDYPSHTLLLEYPLQNAFVKVDSAPTDHDKVWPGYTWKQVGYAWIEVPKGQGVALPPVPVSTPSQTSGATTTTTTTTTTAGVTTAIIQVPGAANPTVISTSPDGTTTVTANGIKSVYPPGSSFTVGSDGSVHVTPLGGKSK